MMIRLPMFLTLALGLGLANPARAGFNTTNFTDVGLTAPDSYFNAFNYNSTTMQSVGLKDPTTAYPKSHFVSGGNTFNNSYGYYAGFGGYFSGWAVSDQVTSSVTPYVDQKTTPDVNYQYISAAGSGNNGPGTPFAVAAAGGAGTAASPSSAIINLAAGTSAYSVDVTNTLYDVYSITHGDGFATAFAPGNQFNLMIYGYTGLDGKGSMIGGAPIVVPLANDTATGGLSILQTWYTQDLTSLAGAQSLVFGVQSNESNAYGDVIPSLFDLNNLVTVSPSSVPEPSSLLLCLGGLGIVSVALRHVRSRKGQL